MGVAKDLGKGVVLSVCPVTGWPVDEDGRILNPLFDGFTPWQEGTELYRLTSPYGLLEYAVGDGDSFVCFDFGTITGPMGSFIVLDSTHNDDRTCFIGLFDYTVLPINTAEERKEAVRRTDAIVEAATGWAGRHDRKGWNQDRRYFLRSVLFRLFPGKARQWYGNRKITDRMMRMGSEKLDRLIDNEVNNGQ